VVLFLLSVVAIIANAFLGFAAANDLRDVLEGKESMGEAARIIGADVFILSGAIASMVLALHFLAEVTF
jgi:hypothetical protein